MVVQSRYFLSILKLFELDKLESLDFRSSAKAQPSVATKAQLKFGVPPSGKFKSGLRPGRSSFPFHRRSPATFSTSNDPTGSGLLLGPPSVSDGQSNNFSCGPTTSTSNCTGGGEELNNLNRDQLGHPYFSGSHLTVPTSNPLSVVPPPLFSPGLPQQQPQQLPSSTNSLMNTVEPLVQMISPVSQPMGGVNQISFGSFDMAGGGYGGPFGNPTGSNKFPTSVASNFPFGNHSGPTGRNSTAHQRQPIRDGCQPVLDQQSFTDLGLRSQLKLPLVHPTNNRETVSGPTDDRKLIVRPALTGAEIRKIDQSTVARIPDLNGNSFNDDDDIDSVELYTISIEQTLW